MGGRHDWHDWGGDSDLGVYEGVYGVWKTDGWVGVCFAAYNVLDGALRRNGSDNQNMAWYCHIWHGTITHTRNSASSCPGPSLQSRFFQRVNTSFQPGRNCICVAHAVQFQVYACMPEARVTKYLEHPPLSINILPPFFLFCSLLALSVNRSITERGRRRIKKEKAKIYFVGPFDHGLLASNQALEEK
jgi:hypothetical protein